MKNICIIVFDSPSESLRLYRKLKIKKYNVNIISTPCAISASCTRAIEFNKEDLNDIVKEIKNIDGQIKAIYEKTRVGGRFKYTSLDI